MKKALSLLFVFTLMFNLIGCQKTEENPPQLEKPTSNPTTEPEVTYPEDWVSIWVITETSHSDTPEQTKYSYSEKGIISRKEDSNSHTEVEFDENGFPRKESFYMKRGTKDLLSSQKTYVYDVNGIEISSHYYNYEYEYSSSSSSYELDTTTEGRTENKYDNRGNLIEKTTFGNDNKQSRRYTYTYDDQNNLVNECYYSDGSTAREKIFYYYNEDNKLIQTHRYFWEDHTIIDYTYDENGVLIKEEASEFEENAVDPSSGWLTLYKNGLPDATYNFNAQGESDGKRLYAYDASGNRISSLSYDTEGNITFGYELIFSSDGRCVEVTEIQEDKRGTATIEYDDNGNITKVTINSIYGTTYEVTYQYQQIKVPPTFLEFIKNEQKHIYPLQVWSYQLQGDPLC